MGESYWFSDGVFGFTPNLNHGALWGIGQGQTTLFVGMSFIALAFTMIWLFKFKAAKSLWITISLGLICSGTLGNLYDRLGIPGLTDAGQKIYAVFVTFSTSVSSNGPSSIWPMSFSSTGAVMLAWYTLFLEESDQNEAKSESK